MDKRKLGGILENDSDLVQLDFLQEQINRLKKENQALKNLLDEAGIPYGQLSTDDDVI